MGSTMKRNERGFGTRLAGTARLIHSEASAVCGLGSAMGVDFAAWEKGEDRREYAGALFLYREVSR